MRRAQVAQVEPLAHIRIVGSAREVASLVASDAEVGALEIVWFGANAAKPASALPPASSLGSASVTRALGATGAR